MNIIGRKHWGAKPPTSTQGQHVNDIHTLVVHHTVGKRPYTAVGAARELRNMQNYHMNANGWSDIGYNLVIDGWGRVWEGRGIRRVGAHTANHNTGTIGVSFMGDYRKYKLNSRQLKAFADLRVKLRQHGVEIEQVKGHRQMPGQSTTCPTDNIINQLGL